MRSAAIKPAIRRAPLAQSPSMERGTRPSLPARARKATSRRRERALGRMLPSRSSWMAGARGLLGGNSANTTNNPAHLTINTDKHVFDFVPLQFIEGPDARLRVDGVEVATAAAAAQYAGPVEGMFQIGAARNVSGGGVANGFDGKMAAAGIKAIATAGDLATFETALRDVATAKGISLP